MNIKERRRAYRKAVRLEIYYSTPMEIFTSLSQNLNEGGIFIETDRPAPIGTVVEINFISPVTIISPSRRMERSSSPRPVPREKTPRIPGQEWE